MNLLLGEEGCKGITFPESLQVCEQTQQSHSQDIQSFSQKFLRQPLTSTSAASWSAIDLLKLQYKSTNTDEK